LGVQEDQDADSGDKDAVEDVDQMLLIRPAAAAMQGVNLVHARDPPINTTSLASRKTAEYWRIYVP